MSVLIAGTVWLYGDAVNHPGLRGFFASARKEYKGDRIRVVISSKPGVDYKKLIESARPLDLQTNYFEGQRNGVHAPVQTKVLSLAGHTGWPVLHIHHSIASQVVQKPTKIG